MAKKLYSREVKTDNWSLVKEISILTPSFFLANILSALYDYFVISPNLNLTVLLWQFQIWGFLILIFPIFGYLYFLHNSSRWLKKQREDELDQLLTISGNGKADVITIAINETLYFKASDNYVEVFIQKPSGIQKHIIRAKLMSVYEQVKEAGFVQVHRSYLVNIFLRPELIMENGNYEICFSGLETKIPVSRTYLKEFRKKLAEVPL
ncbi:MAG TPA: LytTR family DNA-binding domain-containing protein [Chitinophagaceae bacterium]|nr:LytTR family DNA-binding domain-containing protein [Chitinophagaceae bacterium]